MRRLISVWLVLLASVQPLTAAAAPTADSAPSREELERLADAITARVVQLRGLALKRPIARGVLSKDEIRAKLLERINKEFPPQEIAAEGAVLKRLGLIPRDADYLKLILDLLTDQVAGFYDPFRRQLYIADWMPAAMQQPALAHEIAHGLQDQHFDLRRYTAPLKGESDRQIARAALVEGDGTAVMLAFVGIDLGSVPPQLLGMLRPMLQSFSSPVLQRTPRFLRESLMFPYLAGLDFVLTLRRRLPWSAIDRFYARPPESTEQILHPERFLVRERPVPIVPRAIPALAPAREVWRDTFGEAQLRNYLEEFLPRARAETAAAGWGGDRAVAYRLAGSSAVAVVLDTVWDGEQDAIEFEEAQRAVLARLAGRPPAAAGSPAVYADAAGLVYAVARRGDRVLSAFGVPAAAWPRIAAEVPRTWKVRRR